MYVHACQQCSWLVVCAFVGAVVYVGLSAILSMYGVLMISGYGVYLNLSAT